MYSTLRKSLPLLHIPSWPNMPTDMRSKTVVSPDIPTKEISILTGYEPNWYDALPRLRKIRNAQQRLSECSISIQ
jgi:hypothetical protein